MVEFYYFTIYICSLILFSLHNDRNFFCISKFLPLYGNRYWLSLPSQGANKYGDEPVYLDTETTWKAAFQDLRHNFLSSKMPASRGLYHLEVFLLGIMISLALVPFIFIMMTIMTSVDFHTSPKLQTFITIAYFFIPFLCYFLFNLPLSLRRLKDSGQSFFVLLLILLPIVGPLILVCMLSKPTKLSSTFNSSSISDSNQGGFHD